MIVEGYELRCYCDSRDCKASVTVVRANRVGSLHAVRRMGWLLSKLRTPEEAAFCPDHRGKKGERH